MNQEWAIPTTLLLLRSKCWHSLTFWSQIVTSHLHFRSHCCWRWGRSTSCTILQSHAVRLFASRSFELCLGFECFLLPPLCSCYHLSLKVSGPSMPDLSLFPIFPMSLLISMVTGQLRHLCSQYSWCLCGFPRSLVSCAISVSNFLDVFVGFQGHCCHICFKYAWCLFRASCPWQSNIWYLLGRSSELNVVDFCFCFWVSVYFISQKCICGGGHCGLNISDD